MAKISKKFKKDIKRFAREEIGKHARLDLHPETKKSISALVFLCLAAVFILSAFDRAGPAGKVLHGVFDYLLGIGYFAVPSFLVVGGVLLLLSVRYRPKMVLVGGLIIFTSGLGFADILESGRGGLVGAVGGLVEKPFGFSAGLLVNLFLFAAGFLVAFNIPLKLPRPGEKNGEIAVSVKSSVAPTVSVVSPEIKGDVAAEVERAIEKEEGVSRQRSAQETRKGKSGSDESILAHASRAARMYVPPPLSLLDDTSDKPSSGDIKANANIIRRTLMSFGIPVEVTEVHVGPAVTRYSLKPAEGVKVSKITTLSNDLALALAAHPVRIEAPIPGKSLVGVEVPNKTSALVRIKHVLVLDAFKTSGPLALALGKDVSGEAVFANIAKMPHLLIAGSTGSGKSVAIHSLIVSLLYKNAPELMRFILIDPKRVELSVYEDIPHLVTPVITDAKKAILALKFAIKEMERRYGMLLERKARDIASFNQHAVKLHMQPLPYLLVIIDELADLMSMYPREIEASIVRLAQMARATGIHLVVSTQRPSVEIITGLIKANITSRIALQVASQVDSRTILDTAGAEKLLGSGDMLYISSELSKPRRLQGVFIGDKEITKVAEFIAAHNRRTAEEVSFAHAEEKDDRSMFENSSLNLEEHEDADADDPLYDEAVETVKNAGKASASLLQRRLKVGYARAARLLDIMEANGVIGPGEGAKPREVYVKKGE